MTIGLLVQVVDHTDQTSFELLDAIAAADFADQTTDLLIEVLISIHPCVDDTCRDEFVLLTVRNSQDGLQLRAEGRQVDLIHRSDVRRSGQDGRIDHDIEVRDPSIVQSHVV